MQLNLNQIALLRKFKINLKTKKLLNFALPKGSSNKSVLFLVNTDDFDLERISTSFQSAFGGAYSIESINFTSKKKRIREAPEVYFSSRDFSIFGNISTEKLQDLINLKYEYVFQFFSKEHFYLNYISANTKANLRIGFDGANPKLVDLIFNTDKRNLDLFFKEAKKYLTIIKKSA